MTNEQGLSFTDWWKELLDLADLEDFKLYPDRELYREYYDLGDTPEEALDVEMDTASEEEEL